MAGIFEKNPSFPRNGEKWSPEEEKSLEVEFSKNKSIDHIAKFHGRTANAIFLKLRNLGLISFNINLNDYKRLNKTSDLLELNALGSIEILRRKKLILSWWEEGNFILSDNQKNKFLLEPILDDLILKEPSIIKYVILNLQTSNLDLIFKLVDEVSGKPKKPSFLDKLKKENKNNLQKARAKISKIENFQQYKIKNKQDFVKNRNQKSINRGKASFKRFGTVNPPPEIHDLSKTHTYLCSMCGKPVIGNRCQCPTW